MPDSSSRPIYKLPSSGSSSPVRILEERCLCQLISADKSDLVIVAEGEGNIVKDLDAVDRLGEILDLQYFISDLAVRAEIDVRIFTAGRTDVIQLDFFQCTLSGGCLLGLGSVGREAGDEILQLLDFFFLLFVRFLHLTDEQLAGLIPEVVVTGIELNLAVVDVCDLCADLVQKVTVVGYDDNGVLEIDQEFLEPVDRVEVEMVRRLVEQQDVRIAEQCAVPAAL